MTDKTELFSEAYVFAEERHRRQRYDEGPYTDHLDAVVNILLDYGAGEELIAAGALHDVVEDTPTTIEEIRERFGDKVASMVDRLTDQPGGNRKARHAKTYQRIAEDNDAIMVKLADRIANIEHSLYRAGEDILAEGKLKMYITEHAEFVEALYDSSIGLGMIWEHLEAVVEAGRQELGYNGPWGRKALNSKDM